MLEAKNRKQLKKLLEDKSLRIMAKNDNADTYATGNEYVEAENLREWLIEIIKSLHISFFKDGKQFFALGYTLYYLEEKKEIPTTIENIIPENITWN